jgi:putative hemolysin
LQPKPIPSAVKADTSYPRHAAFLPPESDVPGARYGMRFASSLDDLTAIQRLRFQVFNLELGEGLEESFATGLDRDEFDLNCHHVLVTDLESNEVVGTYRIQTAEMAAAGPGFYTSGEFELGGLPPDFFGQSVEAGRACVAKDHRNGRVLNQLWKGLASYLIWNRKRYLFGCCSLSSQDPNDAKEVFDFLVRGRFLHAHWPTRPLADYVCFGADFKADLNTPVRLPPLFASYLKLGAKITGPPAIDRRFKTIDFLVILDVQELDPSAYRTFFS